MRWFIATLLMSWLPLVAHGQQATVRSGEHDGYSRLVAPLPSGASWKVTQKGRAVTFSVDGYNQGFDLDGIFAFIPPDRVKKINPMPNGFVIDLGCDCRVAPFVEQDRYVVLDIVSPGISRPVPFIPVFQTANSAPPPLSATVMSDDKAEKLPPITEKRPDAVMPLDLPVLARTALSEIEQTALNEIQRRLTEELGSAATRGLLTPVPGPSLPVVRRPQVDLSAIVPAIPADPEPMVPEVLDGLVNNMRVSSSMDLPGLALQTSDPQSLSGLACPLNDALDISNWADNRPFHQQAGDGRRNLFQEFDRLDRSAALNLAKVYIHFGFGAEAQQIFKLDDELMRSEVLLMDIATIMETGVAPPNSMLRSLLDCETDVALWAILARENLDVARTIDPRPALLALNKLPVHLRKFLAPALSRRLLSHGDSDAAATALRNLERLPSTLPSSAKLAQAEIAIDKGEFEKGAQQLEDVIDDNVEQSPEALIRLVETQLETNQPLAHETASLIEAYAKELNGTDLGPKLRRAHVLALVKSGQFDRAFAATKELGGESEDDAAVNLRLRLLGELTAAADDVVFLEHVFEQSPHDIARLPIKRKMALATRLVELGFAEQAQDVVAEMPDRPRHEGRQMLAAQIALDLSQPMRAQAELLEMTGQAVDLMRAKAKQMAGAHGEAAAFYRLAKNEDAATRAAWLAEDRESPTLIKNAIFGPTLALSGAEITPSTETNGMLARSSSALEESRIARQTLMDLLRAPQLNIGFDAMTE